MVFIPPTLKKLKGHIALDFSVHLFIRTFVIKKLQFSNFISGFLIKNSQPIFLGGLNYLLLCPCTMKFYNQVILRTVIASSFKLSQL